MRKEIKDSSKRVRIWQRWGAVNRSSLRIVAREAGVAVSEVVAAEHVVKIGRLEVTQRICSDAAADLGDRMRARDKVFLIGDVRTVITRMQKRRRADPDVDLGRARIAKQMYLV